MALSDDVGIILADLDDLGVEQTLTHRRRLVGGTGSMGQKTHGYSVVGTFSGAVIPSSVVSRQAMDRDAPQTSHTIFCETGHGIVVDDRVVDEAGAVYDVKRVGDFGAHHAELAVEVSG